MNKVIMLKDHNGQDYPFEIADTKTKHFGVDDIYAIAVYYSGDIIYNLDFNPEKEKTIILTD